MKLTLKVTQEHIDKGTPEEPASCPIALACREAGFTDVTIGSGPCNYLTAKDGSKVTFRDSNCDAFIDTFDKGGYKNKNTGEVREFRSDWEPEFGDEVWTTLDLKYVNTGRGMVVPFEVEIELLPRFDLGQEL